LCKTYRHRPFYLHLSQGSETQALIPLMEIASFLTGRRGVCLPFSDFCTPLLFGESVQSAVLSKLSQLAITRNWRFLEIRGATNPSASTAPAATFYRHEIDLSPGPNHLFLHFKSGVRRAIRSALKKGVSVETSRSRESLSAFYELHLRTRRRHGLPPQPSKFFDNICDELLNKGLGFVALARSDSRPIAAAVFFQLGEKAVYKYAASDERYQGFRANDLVMWEGINFLMREGARSLSLGRTSLEDAGLRRFKSGWNAAEELLHYFRFDVSRNSWLTISRRSRNAHKQIFGRLPLKVNQLAGSMIYPHLD
jgi:hypothetical protein